MYYCCILVYDEGSGDRTLRTDCAGMGGRLKVKAKSKLISFFTLKFDTSYSLYYLMSFNFLFY